MRYSPCSAPSLFEALGPVPRRPRSGRGSDAPDAGTALAIRRPAAVALDILEWQALDLAGLDWAAELTERAEP